jgi:biotin carboxyl carrier protein
MPQERDGAMAASGAAIPATAETRTVTPVTAARRVATTGATPSGVLDARTERDHAAISKLADELLPALIAKLAATGLGEIEVREGEWKARLRRPSGAEARKTSGHGPSDGQPASGTAARTAAVRVGRAGAEERERLAREEKAALETANLPIVATSPAVGVYQPRKDLAVGLKVRAGDRLGTVDVLGVREDVVAPVDGLIGTSLVEAGEAVEYGQELVRIELPENARGLEVNGADREAAAVLGEA